MPLIRIAILSGLIVVFSFVHQYIKVVGPFAIINRCFIIGVQS